MFSKENFIYFLNYFKKIYNWQLPTDGAALYHDPPSDRDPGYKPLIFWQALCTDVYYISVQKLSYSFPASVYEIQIKWNNVW